MNDAVTEDDLYESLPPSTSRLTHITAGALAGISEHAFMYPIDSIKVITFLFYELIGSV